MKIKKSITSFLFALMLVTLVLSVNIVLNEKVNAEFNGYLDVIEDTTNLPTYDTGTHGQSINKPGVSNLTSAIYFTVDFFKLLIGTIAVIMIILTGGRLIMARKKIDDVFPKMKEQMIMLAAGVVMILIADWAIKNVFFGIEGEVYSSESAAQSAANKATEQIKGFYNLGMLIAGSLAIFMMVVAGFRLIFSAGNEEEQTKVKKQITWLVVGLFILGIAEFVVVDLLFPDKGAKIPDVNKGILLLVKFTNFASAFISLAAFVSLMYAGFLYVSAGGNDEGTQNAKKVATGAVIAMVLGLGAFALVNTVIKLEPGI